MSEYSDFKNLLECKLCETINVIFPDFKASGKFKIVKTVWNVLTSKYDEMELGDLSVSLSEALGITNSAERTSDYGDYVTEIGSSGIWKYRKWKSGRVECWGVKTASYAVNTSSASYGGYRSGQLNIDAFPVTYVSAPTIFGMIGSGSQGAWVNNITPTTTGGTFYLSCGSSLAAADRTIYFYVSGV